MSISISTDSLTLLLIVNSGSLLSDAMAFTGWHLWFLDLLRTENGDLRAPKKPDDGLVKAFWEATLKLVIKDASDPDLKD
tara:strand:+ start:465 stop:704 length:240 start_codon:yes stop_codon:yes gene_type:complete